MSKLAGAVGIVIALAYLYGLVVGGLVLASAWLFRDQLPALEWWQYLLAPLGLGFTALALEGLGEIIAGARGKDHPDVPPWKRSIELVIVFVLLAALILGPAIYNVGSS